MCFQMSCLMEENPEKEVRVEVAVDADFMERMIFMRPTIVAQFGYPLKGDVEMNLMTEEVVVNSLHRLERQVITEYPAILFFWCQNVGQSQSLRLCLCMLTPLLHAEKATPATSRRTISRNIVFFFIFAITEEIPYYCSP